MKNLPSKIMALIFVGMVVAAGITAGPVWVAVFFLFVGISITFEKARKADEKVDSLLRDLSFLRNGKGTQREGAGKPEAKNI